MIPIVTPEEMAAIDAAAPEPVEVLIARAGWEVARAARDLLGGTYGRRVVVVAGSGNNGADGRHAAALLERRGVRVTIVDPSGRIGVADRPGPDAETDGAAILPPCDLIVDAAFGTGLNRRYVAPRPAEEATPVLAVDIPSGLSGLTGGVLGAPLRATATVTFAALKPGLICGSGPELTGHVDVVDIGLDTSQARAHLVTGDDVAAWLPVRDRHIHKWRGAVRLVAGSPGMGGAADLAAAGAFRAGAGYVRRSTPGVDPADAALASSGRVEAVVTALPSKGWAAEVLRDIERFGALAVGPGLGRGPDVDCEIAELLRAGVPVVVDGDGLRALGEDPTRVVAARDHALDPVVLTPHEGEFVALGGDLADGVDRFGAVRELAARTGAVVLLKGPTTLVAHPDGRVLASMSGDDRLATAGTGDVLTGIVAALLAQGLDPLQAASAAAWVHGAAARLGPSVGLCAADLPDLAGRVLSSLRSADRHPLESLGDDGATGPRPVHPSTRR